MHIFFAGKKSAFIVNFFFFFFYYWEPEKHCTSDQQIVGEIRGSCRLCVSY